MKENKMLAVANLLGIEFGDTICVKRPGFDFYENYKFTKDGLVNIYDVNCYAVLVEILAGTADFKKAWTPKTGECYFSPTIINANDTVVKWEWCDSGLDYSRLENGLVCKTAEEAIYLANWILEQVRKYRK